MDTDIDSDRINVKRGITFLISIVLLVIGFFLHFDASDLAKRSIGSGVYSVDPETYSRFVFVGKHLTMLGTGLFFICAFSWVRSGDPR